MRLLVSAQIMPQVAGGLLSVNPSPPQQAAIIAAVLAITIALATTIVIARRHRRRKMHRTYTKTECIDTLMQPPSDKPTDTAPPTNKKVTQSQQGDDMLMQRILDIMENTTQYCQPDFGVAQLTALVGSNINYVPRVIKAKLAMSVPQFINQYRIREAQRRMSDHEHYGNYTLQAIAQSVGFKSQNNFIAAFKRITGITPSLYLKRSRTTHPDQTTKNNSSDN